MKYCRGIIKLSIPVLVNGREGIIYIALMAHIVNTSVEYFSSIVIRRFLENLVV